jgi:hypothetical protein
MWPNVNASGLKQEIYCVLCPPMPSNSCAMVAINIHVHETKLAQDFNWPIYPSLLLFLSSCEKMSGQNNYLSLSI